MERLILELEQLDKNRCDVFLYRADSMEEVIEDEVKVKGLKRVGITNFQTYDFSVGTDSETILRFLEYYYHVWVAKGYSKGALEYLLANIPELKDHLRKKKIERLLSELNS